MQLNFQYNNIFQFASNKLKKTEKTDRKINL